jgi:TPR repeat protein/putative methionine-R-sulfoxide reductase with GAF domain
MAAISSLLRTVSPNRRRRVRHKIQTPAYASFTTESKNALVDLHEIVDISEDGASIQCAAPLELNRRVNLCLDLAESAGPIFTTGQVTWSSPTGRCGLRFSELAPVSLFHLREWLFLNAMAGVANAEIAMAPPLDVTAESPQRLSYTDALAAVTAVQREVESLGADLEAALSLILARTQNLLRASSVAIALGADDPEFMVCRASVGSEAPPLGAHLRVGSGFSGESVLSGKLLRCDDAETDHRVHRESCRILGIRSVLAAPLRAGKTSVGLIEVFSPRPNFFTEDDGTVLQRLAETALAALNRANAAKNAPPPSDFVIRSFPPAPGSVLFASPEEHAGEQNRKRDLRQSDLRQRDLKQNEEQNANSPSDKNSGGISLPLSHLVILICAAATIALALGYRLAPTIQQRLHARGSSPIQTVLASSPPVTSPLPAPPSIETATIEQLKSMADNGDAAAENALGRRYATGDAVPLDESAAAGWFSKAAEHGNVSAQSKLGSLYFAGRGVPKDLHQAYFWTVLARAGGDRGSKELAKILFDRMTRSQSAAIEQQANIWLQQHQSTAKPPAAH